MSVWGFESVSIPRGPFFGAMGVTARICLDLSLDLVLVFDLCASPVGFCAGFRSSISSFASLITPKTRMSIGARRMIACTMKCFLLDKGRHGVIRTVSPMPHCSLSSWAMNLRVYLKRLWYFGCGACRRTMATLTVFCILSLTTFPIMVPLGKASSMGMGGMPHPFCFETDRCARRTTPTAPRPAAARQRSRLANMASPPRGPPETPKALQSPHTSLFFVKVVDRRTVSHHGDRLGDQAVREVDVRRGRGERHLARRLHRGQGQVRGVPATHGWSLPEEALPQGHVPRDGAPRLRAHAQGPQQRQEAQGRAHRAVNAGDHPPAHGPEPRAGRRPVHPPVRPARGLDARRLGRCRAPTGRRHVAVPPREHGALPAVHGRARGGVP
mmetsp:Transcript_32161/g.108274  ORF Transcript_32161/g.108274 Transcript_32161/m.108274 type:complete len:384 (-) Transcript_32161:181-1332(-)